MKISVLQFVTKEEELWESLDQALVTQKNLGDEVFVLNYDLEKTYNIYFEREKGADVLTLSLARFETHWHFKFVWGYQLVDDIWYLQLVGHIASRTKDTRVELEYDKTTKGAILEATHLGGTLYEYLASKWH